MNKLANTCETCRHLKYDGKTGRFSCALGNEPKEENAGQWNWDDGCDEYYFEYSYP